MSKIGKQPIILPVGVTCVIHNNLITITWIKGTLSYQYLHQSVACMQEESQIIVSLLNPEHKNIRGLTRTLVSNMVVGVAEGYIKKLQVLWVGYGVKILWSNLELSIWLSHKVHYVLPASVSVIIEKDAKWNDNMTFTSIDKQLLGQTVATIRSLKAPEPYKGKGIRYSDEVIKLKAGKAAAKK